MSNTARKEESDLENIREKDNSIFLNITAAFARAWPY